LLVAGSALVLAAVISQSSEGRPDGEAVAGPAFPDNPHSAISKSVYVVIALSGLCALAAEAIWTRTLGLLLGPSVYTFSIILAVFLTSLGIGSALGALIVRNLARPRVALGVCQLLAAAAIAWTAYSLSASLPYWPVNPSISSNIW